MQARDPQPRFADPSDGKHVELQRLNILARVVLSRAYINSSNDCSSFQSTRELF